MGELRTAAEEVLGLPVEMQGSGRTDAGVHAAAQVMHLRCDIRRPPSPEVLLHQDERESRADIALVEVEAVPNRFHADTTRSRVAIPEFDTQDGLFQALRGQSQKVLDVDL